MKIRPSILGAPAIKKKFRGYSNESLKLILNLTNIVVDYTWLSVLWWVSGFLSGEIESFSSSVNSR